MPTAYLAWHSRVRGSIGTFMVKLLALVDDMLQCLLIASASSTHPLGIGPLSGVEGVQQTGSTPAREGLMVARSPHDTQSLAISLLALLVLTPTAECQSLAANIQRLEAATRVNPADASAYRSLAEEYAKDRKMRAASETMKTAIGLRPTDGELYRIFGTFVRKTGDEAAALDAFRAAIALDPGNGWAHFNLGNSKALKGPEAIAAFRAALVADPKLIPAYLNLGNRLINAGREAGAYGNGGQLDEGLNVYRDLAAISADNDPGRVYDQLLSLNRHAEAAFAYHLAEGRRGRQPVSAIAQEWRQFTRDTLRMAGDTLGGVAVDDGGDDGGDGGGEGDDSDGAAPTKCISTSCIEGFDVLKTIDPSSHVAALAAVRDSEANIPPLVRARSPCRARRCAAHARSHAFDSRITLRRTLAPTLTPTLPSALTPTLTPALAQPHDAEALERLMRARPEPEPTLLSRAVVGIWPPYFWGARERLADPPRPVSLLPRPPWPHLQPQLPKPHAPAASTRPSERQRPISTRRVGRDSDQGRGRRRGQGDGDAARRLRGACRPHRARADVEDARGRPRRHLRVQARVQHHLLLQVRRGLCPSPQRHPPTTPPCRALACTGKPRCGRCRRCSRQ